MNPILRFLLGLRADEIPPEGDSRWELSGLPHDEGFLIALVIVIAAAVLIVLLYRRERNLSLAQRICLSSLRLLALALVVIVLLNPRVVTEIHYEREARTLVMADVSSSMERRDPFEGEEARALQEASGLRVFERPTRAELLAGALEKNHILERLEERNRVQLFAFAEDLRRAGSLQELTEQDLTGAETRIGDGLAELARSGSELVAGIVLLSDGRTNAGLHPFDLLRSTTARPNVPVHTVGVGKEEVVKNYAVQELSAPDLVEVGFPIQINARVLLSGIRGPTKVLLRRSRQGTAGRVDLEERILDPQGVVLETTLKFVDTPQTRGEYRYTVEFEPPPHPEESNQRDNRRSLSVTVAEQQFRVLLVAGTPTFEYQHLTAFMDRDQGIQLSCWLSSADPARPQDGDIRLDALPRDAGELEAYDVVVLLDPDPSTLSTEFQRGLITFVSEYGGGLAYVAGEAYTHQLAGAAEVSRLLKLLPVYVDPVDANAGSYHERPWRPRLTANGLAHPICQLDDEEEANRRLWATLPPFYWAYPTRRLKPGAIALLAGNGNQIVGALQQAGIGETLYIAADGLCRWRGYTVGTHERFWAGVVRYLAEGKRRAGMREITVETDRDRYTEGDQVEILLHLYKPGEAIEGAPHHEVTIAPRQGSLAPEEEPGPPRRGLAPGGSAEEGGSRTATSTSPSTVRLYPVKGNPRRFSGYFRATRRGEFGIAFDGKEMTSFKVRPASSEFQDPTPNFSLLQEISEDTGGSFFRLQDIDSLPDLIPEASRTEVIGETATRVWDSAALMVLFCGLLIAEWVLRKLWHLN